jgi:hypothetical protein
MNDSLRPLVCDDEQLWLEANTAAQEAVQQKVCRVLRSVALQALSQRLKRSSSATSSNSRRLVVSADDISAVQSFCTALAERWRAVTLRQGHTDVAAWIHTVATEHAATLYGGTLYGSVHGGIPEVANEAPLAAAAATATTATLVPTAAVTATAAATTATATGTATRPASDPQHMVTAQARLQSLRMPTTSPSAHTNATSSTTAPSSSTTTLLLQQLDRWGGRRATYWPGTWGAIQRAAAQIPARLYKNPPVEVLVVHASQLLTAGGSASSGNDGTNYSTHNHNTPQTPQQQHTRKAIDWLLDRKRKSVGRERLPPKRVKRTLPTPSRNDTATTTTTPTAATIAGLSPHEDVVASSRPASHEGSGTWSRELVRTTFTAAERAALDALVVVVPDDDNNSNINNNSNVTTQQQQPQDTSLPPSVILGALVDLGQWHGHEQISIDHEDVMDYTVLDGGLTDRQKRRYQRQALKQRLGDHTVLDSYNEEHAGGATRRHRRASRLVPTVDEAGRRWLAGDLLGCRVEVRDPHTQDRHVLDFESLELMILDEDKVGDQWPDQEL